MDLILGDMEKYKTTNIHFHAGDVIQHSIWSALYINNFFKDGDRLVDGIPRTYWKLMMVAAVLHDIGKCGDNVFTFFDKPAHPEIGGYYFSKKKYLDIDLKAAVSESNLDYDLVQFLVRWHWMIGGVTKDHNFSEKAWMVYYHFNLACHESNILMYKRPLVFRMLYAIWVADIMASQRPPKSSKTDIPEIDKYGNMDPVHPGDDMYRRFDIESMYDVRERVLRLYETGITNVEKFKEKITLFIRSMAKIGESTFKYQRYTEHPLNWRLLNDAETKQEESKGMEYDADKEVIVNAQMCRDFLNTSSANDIPLVQGFPELKEVPRKLMSEIYAIMCSVSDMFSHNFIKPVVYSEDDPNKISNGDTIGIPENMLVYHGRGYSSCEPPNLGVNRPLWVFKKKRKAYIYATGRQPRTVIPDEKGGCWNIITYKNIKTNKLLNLGNLRTRRKLRNVLMNYKCLRCPETMTAYASLPYVTYGMAMEFMFPEDNRRVNDDGPLVRRSYTDIDFYVASALSQLYPNIDGWYVPISTFDEEVCIFRPYNSLQMIKHQYYNYEKLRSLFETCYETSEREVCNKKIVTAFRENKVVCLNNKAENTMDCFLLEELASKVPEEMIEDIKKKLKIGKMVFTLE